MHGVTEYHFVSGRLSSHREYADDVLVGTELEYYPSGPLKRKLIHDEEDPNRLQMEEYDSDGVLQARGPGRIVMSEAVATGIWHYYLADGTIWYTMDGDNPSDEVQN